MIATIQRRLLLLIAVSAVMIACAPAMAQLDSGSGTALENARRPSVLPNRAPGDLVGAGVARASSAIPLGVIGVNITETSRPASFRATFLADALEVIFRDLNLILPFFQDLIFARAGLGSASQLTIGTPPAVAGGTATGTNPAPVVGNDPASVPIGGDSSAGSDPTAVTPTGNDPTAVDPTAVDPTGGNPSGDVNGVPTDPAPTGTKARRGGGSGRSN